MIPFFMLLLFDFQYRQPDVWCFSAPVKQRRDELPVVTFVRKNTISHSPPNQVKLLFVAKGDLLKS